MYPCIEYIHKDDQLLSWIITDYMLLYNRILSYTSLRKSSVIHLTVTVIICYYNLLSVSLFSSYTEPNRVSPSPAHPIWQDNCCQQELLAADGDTRLGRAAAGAKLATLLAFAVAVAVAADVSVSICSIDLLFI